MWPIVFALIIVGVMWGQQGFPLPKFKTSPPSLTPTAEISPVPESKPIFEAPPQIYPLPPKFPEITPPKSTETTGPALKPRLNLSASGVFQNNPQKEYIEITADYNNKESAKITGLFVQNKKGNKVKIPTGVKLPYLGAVNQEENIYLKPGEKAVVITGKSPTGMNGLQLNTCTGYFNNWMSFEPAIPNECSSPRDEATPDLSDACFDFLYTVSACKMPFSLPLSIDNECRQFINERVNYKHCVEISRNKPNFYKPEWRIYLNQEKEIWSGQKDAIKLINDKGEVIAEKSY